MRRVLAILVAAGLASGGLVFQAVHGGAANVTCGANLQNSAGVNVTGTLVNPVIDTPPATVKGDDVAQADLTCVSLSGEQFSTNLTLTMQYQTASGWATVSSSDCGGNPISFPGGSTGTDPSVSFTSVGPLQCFYAPGDPAVSVNHRAELDWQVTEGSVVVDSGTSFSLTWLMPDECVC